MCRIRRSPACSPGIPGCSGKASSWPGPSCFLRRPGWLRGVTTIPGTGYRWHASVIFPKVQWRLREFPAAIEFNPGIPDFDMLRTFLTLGLLVTTVAAAELPLVDKRIFETRDFRTFGGEVIPQVRVGREAYGELDEDRSNVILVTHHFSGTSHAAGRYSPDDAEPGYWDAIIGPGNAIDTDRFYVISSDTLVNANVHDARVITTGPASIDPRTGRPFGLDFPVVTIRDFVEVQARLLDSRSEEHTSELQSL